MTRILDIAASVTLQAGGTVAPSPFPIYPIVGILVVVAIVVLAASRLGIPYPILLVVCGLGLSGIPGLPPIPVDPDVIFLLFLPPLLYYAGLQTSWRDFRQNIREISLLAVGLVLATMVVIALAVRWLIPDMPWAAAFALGAIVSPPDAIAATAIMERLRIPRRVITILEGESLVNDATALVAYKFAIAAAVAGAFSWTAAGVDLVWVAIGGTGIGLAVAWAASKLMARVRDPLVQGILSLMAPFAAYLPAHQLHLSGVLAAVAAGIFMSRALPKVLSPEHRLRTVHVWDAIVFLMNGIIFVMIGLQLRTIMSSSEMAKIPWTTLAWQASVVSVAAIVVRLLWVYPSAWLPRLIPAVRRRDPNPPISHLTLIGWSGMRGIVSLAAALALPIAFPFRDQIVFLSFAVILSTLVLQGLSLPWLIRRLGLEDDGIGSREERTARIEAAHAALSRLMVLQMETGMTGESIATVRHEYDERIAELRGGTADAAPAESPAKITAVARREAMEAERRMLVYLRDAGIIGDEVMRKLLREIDLKMAEGE